ncbi:MAG TPA: pentapeptide repeat-containing protein [Anaerolineales bacterium]
MLSIAAGFIENASIQLPNFALPVLLAALIGAGLVLRLLRIGRAAPRAAEGEAAPNWERKGAVKRTTPGLVADGMSVHQTAARRSLEGRNLDGEFFSWEDFHRARLSRASLRNTTWLDVDLRGAKLDHADLEGATLSMWLGGDKFAEADLSGADLRGANLRGAHVRDEQLRRAACLIGATMPDGSGYDGRFHLHGDRGLSQPGIWI